MARRLLKDLPVSCSVLVIAARPAPGQTGVQLDPSSLSMDFADGSTVHALDGDSILSHARNDPNGVLRRFNSAYRVDPAQDMYEAFALIPAGTDLHHLKSVSFPFNGRTITVYGRFVSAQERQNGQIN